MKTVSLRTFLIVGSFIATAVLASPEGIRAQNNFPSSGAVTVNTTSGSQAVNINGNLELQGTNGGTRYVITDQINTGTGRLVFQAGAGSAGYGGAILAYAHSHSLHPGDVVAGISAGSGGAFRVNSGALDGGTDFLYVGGANGNVGINTTSPSFKLDVNTATNGDGIRVGAGVTSAQSSANIVIRPSSSSPDQRNWLVSAFYDQVGGLSIRNSNAALGDPYAAGTTRLLIDQSGNLGIGTTTPVAPLHATGGTGMAGGWNRTSMLEATFPVQVFYSNVNSSSSRWGGIGYDYSTGLNFWVNATSNNVSSTGTSALTLVNSGNVGIGTMSPVRKFEVVSGTTDPFFFNGSYNKFKADAGWTYLESYHGTDILIDSSGNYSDRTFSISKGNPGGTHTTLFSVNESGNVTISGTINAKYQDVAEWVPSSEQLAAGTVVVLDSTKSNQVISSSTSYDTRVAGVISAQPGIALGEKSDSKVLVATTGRVKVKVDASKGAIRIGDLLVTSDVPGVAMKSEEINLGGVKIHRPGTLIGKALEPLEKGKGEILVLLSLQ